jgi:hypothetical protein
VGGRHHHRAGRPLRWLTDFDDVDELALIVSAVAAVFSAFAVWYTKRQADAALGVLELEKRRDLERNRPKIAMWFEGWIDHVGKAFGLRSKTRGRDQSRLTSKSWTVHDT